MEREILTEAGAVSAASIDPALNARLTAFAKSAVLPYQTSLEKNYYNRLYMNVLNTLRANAAQGVLTNALDDATLSKQVNATAKNMANQMLLNQQKAQAAVPQEATVEETPATEEAPVEEAPATEEAPAEPTEEEVPAEEEEGKLSNLGTFTKPEIQSMQGVISNVVGKVDQNLEKEINNLPGYKNALRSVDLKFGKILSESKSGIVAYKEAIKALNELPIEITFEVSLGDENSASYKPKKAPVKKTEAPAEEVAKKEESKDSALENALDFLRELTEAEEAEEVVEATTDTMTSALKQIQTSLVKSLGTQEMEADGKRYKIAFTPGDVCQAKDATHGTFSVKIRKTGEIVSDGSKMQQVQNFLQKRKQNKQAALANKQAAVASNRAYKLAKKKAKTDAMYAKAAMIAAKNGNPKNYNSHTGFVAKRNH